MELKHLRPEASEDNHEIKPKVFCPIFKLISGLDPLRPDNREFEKLTGGGGAFLISRLSSPPGHVARILDPQQLAQTHSCIQKNLNHPQPQPLNLARRLRSDCRSEKGLFRLALPWPRFSPLPLYPPPLPGWVSGLGLRTLEVLASDAVPAHICPRLRLNPLTAFGFG